MTQLVRLAYQVAAVGGQRKKIHKAMFGFSLRKALHPAQPHRSADLAAHEQQLEALREDTRAVRQALEKVDFDDITKRSSLNLWIHEALGEYVSAELGAIDALQAICSDLEADTPGSADSGGFRRAHKVAYDASVQEIKRWGDRLDSLFANY
jgi:hypothetical protein